MLGFVDSSSHLGAEGAGPRAPGRARRRPEQRGARRWRQGTLAGRWALVLGALVASCARQTQESPGGAKGAWSLAGRFAGAPIVLVTIDTLRADRVGLYGSPRGLTPHLDRLGRRGTVFRTAVAQVPLTTPSHATILTGLSPARHGIRTNDGFRLQPTVPTLAERLRTAGYATAAFVGAFPLRRQTGLARGFDHYDDGAAPENETLSPSERRAGTVVQAATAWLAAFTARPPARPFFLWVHLFDPHTPYDPPPPYDRQYQGAPYDGEVAYTDACLGDLVDALARHDVLDRSLVVVVADHGESLGEHGEQTHGTFLYDATIRVPLILRLPGSRGGGRAIDGPVETSDLAPTLAALVGVALEGTDGRSLVPLLESGAGDPERPTYAESYYQHVLLGWSPLRAVRTAQWKFVEAPRPELYNLVADPGEMRNLAGERPALVRGLRAALPRAVPPRRPWVPEADAARPDAESAERLRSLGYFSGHATATSPALVDPKDRIDVWADLERGLDLVDRDPVGAARAFEHALARDPANGLALKYLGDLSYRAGRHGEAFDRYRRAAEQGFVHPDVFVNLAASAVALGRLADARAALERALGLDPSIPEAWNQLGIVQAALGNDAAAREAFERARALAPGRAEPYYNLALLERRRGQDKRARALLQDALARRPAYPEALFELANSQLAAGRVADAYAAYRAALAARPDYVEALFGLARAAAALGRTDEAREAYQRFIALAPPTYRTHVDLAREALRRLGAGRAR